MNKNTFYITTTLPYVNAEPHIGFALETIQADVLARYHRIIGDKVFFNTGTDEHGLKISRKAAKNNLSPQEFVDEYAAKFQELKNMLNLSYTKFIRTTDKDHIQAAKRFWKICKENGDIYKAEQEIKYCVGCEMEKTESELEEGCCPLHPNKEIETFKEENYFFRFSKYEQLLLDFYKENPDFIVPQYRLKEIKKFIKGGLKDFSISRIKEKMPWGIEVPGDSDHVMYVWFDALINYISTLGWPKDLNSFNKWWPGYQVAGKDNLRQQTAIWQAMLMSARLPNSKQILIHGFITADGQKMSKSIGNVVSPKELVNKYGAEAVRYYLLKEVPATKDGDFTHKHFEEVYNADLANGLGNLVQRVAKLCELADFSLPEEELKRQTKINKKIGEHIKNYSFNKALILVWKDIQNLDRKINKQKPWEKEGQELKTILKTLVKQIINISINLKPFLPETAEIIRSTFISKQIQAPEKPLFPRV
jgi:methionyl-tRNA synthetase